MSKLKQGFLNTFEIISGGIQKDIIVIKKMIFDVIDARS